MYFEPSSFTIKSTGQIPITKLMIFLNKKNRNKMQESLYLLKCVDLGESMFKGKMKIEMGDLGDSKRDFWVLQRTSEVEGLGTCNI